MQEDSPGASRAWRTQARLGGMSSSRLPRVAAEANHRGYAGGSRIRPPSSSQRASASDVGSDASSKTPALDISAANSRNASSVSATRCNFLFLFDGYALARKCRTSRLNAPASGLDQSIWSGRALMNGISTTGDAAAPLVRDLIAAPACQAVCSLDWLVGLFLQTPAAVAENQSAPRGVSRGSEAAP